MVARFPRRKGSPQRTDPSMRVPVLQHVPKIGLGLQFHLETTAAGARAMIDHCPDDLRPGRWVQSEREILCDPTRFGRTNDAMRDVLAWLARGGV